MRLLRSKKSKVIFFILLLVLLSVASVWIYYINSTDTRSKASEPKLKFTQTNATSWFLVDRPNEYDYAPSAHIDGSTWNVWTCGSKSQIVNGQSKHIPGDWIYRTNIVSGSNTGTVEVLAPSTNPLSMDSKFTCAPSVVQFNHPYIKSRISTTASKLYMMHYECSPKFLDVEAGFTEICVAYSIDGTNWYKYNKELWDSSNSFTNASNAVATSVIKAAKARSYCNPTISGNSYAISSSATCRSGRNYGSGHPSTILRDTNGSAPGGEQIYMWYYDSGNGYDGRAIYLAKSWDGFNFETPVKTNIRVPIQVVYYVNPQAGKPNYYIGLAVIQGRNAYAYSTDGITWKYFDNNILNLGFSRFGTGSALPDSCASPSQASILSNSRGIVTSSYINILSAEGKLGTSDGIFSTDSCYSAVETTNRGTTWGLRLIQGNLLNR